MYSEGCNNLIKTNRSALIQSAKDLEYIMGWESFDKLKMTTEKAKTFKNSCSLI